MKNKVLLLGIDGATFDNLLPFIGTGRLKFLKSVMEDGSHGHLRSTIQPVTPPAWTSMLSGRNPGKTGIFDFMQLRKNSYDIEYANSSFRTCPALWDYLNRASLTAGIHNVPMTFPAESLNGFLVSGLGTPGTDSRFTYPEALKEELVREFGRYRLLDYGYDSRTREDYIKKVFYYMDENIRVVEYLMKNHPTDLLMTVFMSIDHLQHFFLHCDYPEFRQDRDDPKYSGVILDAYERLDKGLSKIVACGGFSHIIIASDHGFSPIRWFVDLNKYLEEAGFLAFNKSKGMSGAGSDLLGRARLAVRQNLPKKWKHWIANRLPNMKNSVDSALFTGIFDWKNTKAFALGTYGNIRINLKGREPEGVVEEDDYNSVRNAIKDNLLKMKDPDTGEAIVERVYFREEIYRGEALQAAADLVLKFKDYKYYAFPKLRYESKATVFYKKPKELQDGYCLRQFSQHAENGIFMMKGHGVKKGFRVEGAEITDILPTVLHAMGLPVPEDVDGKVLNIFDEDYMRKNPVSIEKADGSLHQQVDFELDDREREEIEKSLKGLGYF